MNDIRYLDPLADLAALGEAMRQLLDEGWVSPRGLLPAILASVSISVDVLDTGPDITVRAGMPGVKAEQLDLTLNGSTLTLKGEIEAETEFEGTTYLRREWRAATFTRSLTLPVAVEADRVQASLRDGVLTLTLPKSESVQSMTIKVTIA